MRFSDSSVFPLSSWTVKVISGGIEIKNSIKLTTFVTLVDNDNPM